jgi:pantoate--beta-alanine ligase
VRLCWPFEVLFRKNKNLCCFWCEKMILLCRPNFIYEMKKFYTKAEVEHFVSGQKSLGLSVGFVPTMGALHNGHLNLVRQSIDQTDITIVSIFVNPIQFNNKEDLEKYPRDLNKDLDMLSQIGCHAVFCPNEKEMYPDQVTEKYDLGGLDQTMEGHFRPGHFQGVAIVVKRLFDIVRPDLAFFGKKDFQQYTIIKYVVDQLKLPVKIVGCETVREVDGLAMSSRNALLEKTKREKAVIIPNSLKKAKELLPLLDVKGVNDWIGKEFSKEQELQLEYFEIVDENSLQRIEKWEKGFKMVACIAAWAGNVRLIDNMPLYN